MALRDYLRSEIAADHADGLLTRREALRRFGLMGLSAPAAVALLAACTNDAASSGSPTTVTAAPTSTVAGGTTAAEITFAGLKGAFATAAEPTASVLVVHDNGGLSLHYFDVVGRFAGAGYAALCVDLVTEEGGTSSMDEGAVQSALAAAPVERLLGDLGKGIDELLRRAPDVPVTAVGFCFGGGILWNLLDAGDDRIVAAVPFYGPAPDAPDFTGSATAVFAIYAGKDNRVNATRDRVVAALEAAGVEHRVRTFAGVDHAFFNNTGPRYDEAAANEAWTETLRWIDDHT